MSLCNSPSSAIHRLPSRCSKQKFRKIELKFDHILWKEPHKDKFLESGFPFYEFPVQLKLKQLDKIKDAVGEVYSERGQSILLRINGKFVKMDRDNVQILGTKTAKHYNSYAFFNAIWESVYTSFQLEADYTRAIIDLWKYQDEKWNIFKRIVVKRQADCDRLCRGQKNFCFPKEKIQIQFKSLLEFRRICEQLNILEERQKAGIFKSIKFPWRATISDRLDQVKTVLNNLR